MTMEDLEEFEIEPAKERLTLWVVLAVFWTFYGNIFGAFATFWEELSAAFVAHANYKNERKTFSSSVLEDIKSL